MGAAPVASDVARREQVPDTSGADTSGPAPALPEVSGTAVDRAKSLDGATAPLAISGGA